MKNELEKISIIISTLNCKKTIKKCLDSCLSQDYPNKEIIVIDGKSEDGTVDILKDYKNENFLFLSEKDKSIYEAWNKALLISKGEWLCFLGADDYWSSDSSLKLLKNEVNKKSINYASGKVRVIDIGTKKSFLMGSEWNFNKLDNNITVAHPGSLHHKSLFKKFGLFNEDYKIAGDHEFLIRVGRNIEAVFFDREIIVMLNSGISNKKSMLAFYESAKALKNNKNFGFIKGLKFFIRSIVKYYAKKILWIKK